MGKVGKIAALIPTILLFPAMIALGEEMTFCSPLLTTTHDVIGPGQALRLTTVYFALAHYPHDDSPAVAGFVLTGLVVYLLGKGMLETRGSLRSWFIHIAGDIPIFTLDALTSI